MLNDISLPVVNAENASASWRFPQWLSNIIIINNVEYLEVQKVDNTIRINHYRADRLNASKTNWVIIVLL